MKRNIVMVIILIALSQSIKATNVSGIISTNTIWTLNNSPYIVTDNILVNNGITLTIEPGVVVKFNNLLSMQIDGTLIARGTSTDSIKFTSNITNNAGDWGYIYFSNSSIDAIYENNIYGNYISGSILEYCIIQYAGGTNITNNGALRLNVAYPFINHCKISDNFGAGINAYDYNGIPEGNLKVSNSFITNNISSSEGGGIYIVNADSVLIYNNILTYNNNPSSAGGGIFMSDCDYTMITENYISYNASYGGTGISAGNNNAPPQIKIINNIITNNSSTGGGGCAINTGLSTLEITGNLLLNNINQGGGSISINGGSGYISNNIIADNYSSGSGGGIYIQASTAGLMNNHIVRNTANDISGLYAGSGNSGDIIKNTFAYNTCMDNSTMNNTIYLWNLALQNINNNNIFGDSANYVLFNGNAQGTPNVPVTDNWWGTINSSAIQNKIYDWMDDPTLGIVNYSPYLYKADTAAPVSPPFNVKKINLGGGQVKLTWNQNPEPDIKGYHIYFGGFNGHEFNNMIDIGNDTTCTLSGLNIADTIAVTAYDSTYNTLYETPSTKIPDNMIYGFESWFTYASVDCSTLTISMSAIDASCSTCNDGTATANVSLGLAPYSYAWNTSPIQTNYTATDLLPNTYRVTVTDFNGCVLNDSVIVSFSSSVDKKTNDNLLTVYPVPASNMITISINNKSKDDVILNIYNSMGTLVQSEILKQNNHHVNVEELNNGIYIIELKSNDWTKKRKLIIQRYNQ